MELKLYQIHDNPNRDLMWEETTYDAIWAYSEEEAKAAYQARYKREFGTDPDEYEVCVEVQELPSGITPENGPGRERRSAVLRLVGWRFEDESACECCGLAPMGMNEYLLCPTCECCPECGHDEDCKDDPMYNNLSPNLSASSGIDAP